MLRMQLNSINLNILESASAQKCLQEMTECQECRRSYDHKSALLSDPPGLMNKIQLVLLNNKA